MIITSPCDTGYMRFSTINDTLPVRLKYISHSGWACDLRSSDLSSLRVISTYETRKLDASRARRSIFVILVFIFIPAYEDMLILCILAYFLVKSQWKNAKLNDILYRSKNVFCSRNFILALRKVKIWNI